MTKERMLTVLVPIKDSDCESTVYASEAALIAAVPVSASNINKIYKIEDGTYRRVGKNATTGNYEYQTVVDREFPYLGKPLELFDFTYDANRMGTAATISAQNVMWYADKDSNGDDVSLEHMWSTQDCHVIFNNDILYLKQIPTERKTNEDARYSYDIDFVSENVVLETVYLYDTGLQFMTDVPTSESATFSFYGDIKEFVRRVNASLIRSGLANLARKYVDYPNASGTVVPYLNFNQWNQIGVDDGVLVGTVFSTSSELIMFKSDIYEALSCNYYSYISGYIYENTSGNFTITGYQCVLGKDKYGDDVSSEEKLVSFDKNYVNESLHQIWDVFGLLYYVKKERDSQGNFTGNTLIVIGDCEHDFADMNEAGTDYVRDANGIPTTSNPFDYGYTNALLGKNKDNTTEEIITRITGIGSSDNIPWYYPNPTADGWIKPMYKRNSVVQSVSLSYPTSEGSTDAEHNLYEKYLKNRLGDTIRFGKAVIQMDAILGVVEHANVDTPFGFIFAYYLNVTGSDKKLHYNTKCLYNNLTTSAIAVTKDDASYSGLNLSWNTESIVSIPEGVYRIELRAFPTSTIYKTTAEYYYYYYQTPVNPNINAQCFSKKKDLLMSFDGHPFEPSYWYWYSDPQDPEGSKESVVYPMNGQIFYAWHDNDETTERVDRYEYDGDGVLTKTNNVTIDVLEFIKQYMSGFMAVIQADGWYRNGKKISQSNYDITDYGIEIDDQTMTLSVLDTIEFQRVKYLTPQPNLMPELYINTDGERRFYDAIDYPKRYASGDFVDADAGEVVVTSGSGALQVQMIENPLYKENESLPIHYNFENTFKQSIVHEKIEEFEDAKPSIKGITRTMTIGGVSGNYRIDVVEEFEYDWYDNDEIWEDNDNGNIAGEYKHPYFFAKLRPLGFNLFDMALQEDMVLSMTTGHCGACNFKIGVDENTKKNPVQLWEYDVFDAPTFNDIVDITSPIYRAGTLRRHVDTSQLHYNTNNTEDGYIYVDSQNNTPGFIVPMEVISSNRSTPFRRRTYTSEEIVNGTVGSLKQEPKKHFEGDVMTSGRFIDSQQDTTSNFVWVALFKDTESYGTVMPSAQPDYADSVYSKYIDPKGHTYHNRISGQDESYDDDHADKFVLTNIKMPQIYLRDAEHYLSRLIVANMYDRNYQKYNVGCNFSRIFLAQKPSVESNLNENSVLYIKYNNKIYRQYVKHYTYRMSHEAPLPEISVDMNEELTSTKTKVERQRREYINRQYEENGNIGRVIRSYNVRNNSTFVSRNDNTILNSDIIVRDLSTSVVDEYNRSDDNSHNISRSQFILTESQHNYLDIVEAFDQIDRAISCSFVNVNGTDYSVTYGLPTTRDNYKDQPPQTCTTGGKLWFRTTISQ